MTIYHKGNARRGFTLVELMMVILIMLAVAAIAIPNISSFMSGYRLRSTMSQISGLVQQQRMLAVRSNTTIQASSATVGSRQRAYIDSNGDGSYTAGEPQVILPTNITIDGTGHPGDITGGSASYVTNAPPIFNARGLPCVVQATGLCQNLDTTTATPRQVGYAFYFKDSGVLGVSNWGAMTITPAGRVRVYVWNGASYSQQ